MATEHIPAYRPSLALFFACGQLQHAQTGAIPRVQNPCREPRAVFAPLPRRWFSLSRARGARSTQARTPQVCRARASRGPVERTSRTPNGGHKRAASEYDLEPPIPRARLPHLLVGIIHLAPISIARACTPAATASSTVTATSAHVAHDSRLLESTRRSVETTSCCTACAWSWAPRI
jgi:hypothetical protein